MKALSFQPLQFLSRGRLRDVFILTGLIFVNMKLSFTIAGIVFFTVGAALHFWSKSVLTRNWMVTKMGPYRMVRHPFYLANFIIDMGICFFSGQLWLVILYPFVFVAVYLPVIRKEEEFLIAEHGDDYVNFRKSVHCLIPYRLDRLFGPLDASWTTVLRENEISRLLRILAAPAYFVIVHLVRYVPASGQRNTFLGIALGLAIALNIASILAYQKERLGGIVDWLETEKV